MLWNRRMAHLKTYFYLATNFRNGLDLIRSFRNGPNCHVAILRDGTRLVHPRDREGFVGTMLELWQDRCYTRDGFYHPCAGDQIVDVGAHVGLFSLSMALAIRASSNFVR